MTDSEATAKPAILLSTAQIQQVIPHRWPFLLVDRVIEEDRERGYIRAEKGVTAGEWFFQGHFPQMPVMPGVLQVEALAQTLAVYVGRLEAFEGQVGQCAYSASKAGVAGMAGMIGGLGMAGRGRRGQQQRLGQRAQHRQR